TKLLTLHIEHIRMVMVIARESAYPVGAQKFVFVEHARENPAQALWIYKGSNSASPDAQESGPGWMDALGQVGHVLEPLPQHFRHTRYPFALPGLNDRSCAKR